MDFTTEALDNYLNLLGDPIKTDEIHVLLIDHNKESLNFTAQMLESCLYKVSKVESSSSALSKLSTSEHFDIVMIDIRSPGGFGILHKAVSMQLIIIFTYRAGDFTGVKLSIHWDGVMSEKEEPKLAAMALKRGAFLLINKPVSMEMVQLLWQHALREKLKNPIKEQVDHQVLNQFKEKDYNEAFEDNQKMENRGKKNARSEGSSREDRSRKRKLIDWDNGLHDKFMDAVNQLGEGKCYPKYILQRMNVPGLTRLQVASHLQKCRNNNWRAPEKNKIFLPTPPKVVPSYKKRDNIGRYGTMPPLHMNVTPQDNGETQNVETFGNEEGERPNQECYPSSHDSLQPLHMHDGLDFSFGNAMDLVYESFSTSSDASREGGSGCNNALYTANIGTPNELDTSANQLYKENSDGYPYLSTVINAGEIASSKEQITDDFFDLPEMVKFLGKNMGLDQGSGSSDGADREVYSFEQVYHQEEIPSASTDIEQAVWDPIMELPMAINGEIGSLEFGLREDDFGGIQSPLI